MHNIYILTSSILYTSSMMLCADVLIFYSSAVLLESICLFTYCSLNASFAKP